MMGCENFYDSKMKKKKLSEKELETTLTGVFTRWCVSLM
jgi:hypothetical protein